MSGRPPIGGWLEGPGAFRDPDQRYPGQRLGRPESGSGSVATIGRRALALLVDWLLALLVANAFLDGLGSFGPLVVFAAVQVLLVGTTGFSVGHRLLGIGVVRLDGRVAGPVAAVVRTALLVLVVPAVVMDGDSRGLHDRAAGTLVVRL